MTNTPMAPGARIVVRNGEWFVRRGNPSSDGGRLLTCDSVSALVRGQSSLFLTALEGQIEVLDPAEMRLVADPSSMFNAALLYLESQRRSRVIRRVFDEYCQWVENTLSTEPEPYL